MCPRPELPTGQDARSARREFLRSSAVGGFALAVQPIAAATLSTSAEGLLAGMVEVPASDRGIPAYRAQPAGAGPFPVILVVQEIFGVHEHIRDVCRRLAHAGYLALAPELYVRQGDVSQLASIEEIFAKVVSQVPDAQVLADLDASADWARRNGGSAQLGITGFCWGGRITWLYAAHNPRLNAAVAWYGRLRGVSSALQPRHPIDLAASLKAPVLGLYGGKDEGIPLADVEAMRAALKASGSASEIQVYDDAPHGFHADYRPSYREAAAHDAWQRALAWFAGHAPHA